MKKKLTILLIAAAAAVLLAAAAAVLIWFHSPGIHFLFGNIHLDISETGYVMSENGEILDEATLTINGTAQGNFLGDVLNIFDSNFQFSLTGVPEIAKEDDAYTFSRKIDHNMWSVHTTKVTFNSSKNEPIPTEALLSFTYYTIFVTEEKAFVSCKVEGGNSDDTLYFLCANTPDEALKRFQELNPVSINTG